jgi:hypothetical protein
VEEGGTKKGNDRWGGSNGEEEAGLERKEEGNQEEAREGRRGE